MIKKIDTLEQLQAAAEQKRKMADALAAQSIQREQMTSPFQVLGKLAEALAARNLGKQSESMKADYRQQFNDRMTREINEYNGLPEGVTPQQRAAYALSRQYLPEAFKTQAMKMSTPDMENINGVWTDKNSVKPGDFAANDPSADVFRGADGKFYLNQNKMQQHLAQATGRTAPITITPQDDPMRVAPQAPALPAGYDPNEWAVEEGPAPQQPAVDNNPEIAQMRQLYAQRFPGPQGEAMFQEWLRNNNRGGR